MVSARERRIHERRNDMAQMTIVDRNSIEDGLRRGLSIPEIAKLVSRPPQTVTNEIKSRRIDSAKGLNP